MDIKQKIAEAEAYQKHGLYSEALGLFEELLKSKSGLNAALENKPQKKSPISKVNLKAWIRMTPRSPPKTLPCCAKPGMTVARISTKSSAAPMYTGNSDCTRKL